MNKKSVKFPFAVRTAVIMLAVWLTVCTAATFIAGSQHMEALSKDTENLAEYLRDDLRECVGSNKESVEYKAGINVAEAYSVLRYYRFKKLGDFRKKGAEVDIGLYDTKSDTYGNVSSFAEAVPESGILMASPNNMYGKIIVFDDVFTEEQTSQIEDVVRKCDYIYISKAIGYVDGRFFYPTEIMLGNYENNVMIGTDYRDESKKLKTIQMQDVQVRLADGTVVGGHDRERKQQDNYRPLQKNSETDGMDGGSSYSDSLFGFASSRSYQITSSGYTLKVYMEANYLPYILKKLRDFYAVAAIMIFLLGFVLVSSHNRTIEKRMETEFKRRGMMDSMAHEMKTPLSIIRNYGEVLKEEHDEKKREQFTQNIIDEADGLNRAIVSMLDLSKMEAGTYPMELSSLSVRKIAEKELKRAEILAQKKGVDINLVASGDERILADEKLLVNIISNFISNAIKHTSAGGSITLEISSDSEEAYIGVRNQGEQISYDEMNKIWDSYYGIKSSGTESSGLGLAIVRNACLMHNGSYGCKNEDDGVIFWARICSMEDRIAKAEMTTGPVIGVTETDSLKGLWFAAVGVVLQCITMTWRASELLFHAVTIISAEPVWFEIYNAAEAGLLLIANIIMLAGIYDLYKNSRFEKSHLVLSAETALVSLVLFGFTLWFEPIDPLDDIAPYIFSFILVVLEMVLLVLMAVQAVRIFLQCRRIAIGTGNSRLGKSIIIKMVIFFAALIVWMIETYSMSTVGINIPRQVGMGLIALLAAYSWISVNSSLNLKLIRRVLYAVVFIFSGICIYIC